MIYVEMYKPLILTSPKSRMVAVPVVSSVGDPLALFVEDDEIEGFYKLDNKYYVCLYRTSIHGVRWTPKLHSKVKLDAVDVKKPLDDSFEENAVLRITAPFSIPHICSSTCNAVVLHIKGGSVLVPVTDLCMHYNFITKEFPACVELFAKDLVGSEDIATKAAEICAKIFGTALDRCDSLRGHIVAVACTLVAARMSSYPLTIRELTKRYNIPRSKLYEFYRYIAEKLGVSTREVSIDVHAYIRRIVSLAVSDSVKAQRIAEEAIKLYELAEQHNLTSGRDPKAIAAAAIYIVANEHGARITQLQLTRLTHVTEITIRKRIKELQLLKKLTSNISDVR